MISLISPDIRELKQRRRRQRERQKSDRFRLAKFSMELLRSFRRRLLMFSQTKIRANWFGAVFNSLDRLYYAD